jgi:putative hydrolase
LNLRILPDYIAGVRVYKGVELNIMNREGEVDLPESIIDNLEVVIASLHPPCIRFEDDKELFTDALINTMKRGFVNIIGHPTDPRYPIDIKRVVTAARDYGVLLEVNNASFNGKSSRSGGEAVTIELLRECVRQSMPVILGSDAHYHTQVGDFSNVESLLREANVPKELIINNDTNAFVEFIERKRK